MDRFLCGTVQRGWTVCIHGATAFSWTSALMAERKETSTGIECLERQNMKKINLFIVGAQKSGTTNLYNFLNSLEEIDGGISKEQNLFGPKKTPKLWRRLIGASGPNYNYDSIADAFGDARYLLDSSPSYNICNACLQRIYDYNPEAKIIFVMRNPWQRALSQYQMQIRLETVSGSFEDSLRLEINEDRIDGFQLTDFKSAVCTHIFRSLYGRFLVTLKEIFPPDNLLFLQFEHMIQNRQTDAIAGFLNLDIKGDFPESPSVVHKAFSREALDLLDSYFLDDIEIVRGEPNIDVDLWLSKREEFPVS